MAHFFIAIELNVFESNTSQQAMVYVLEYSVAVMWSINSHIQSYLVSDVLYIYCFL